MMEICSFLLDFTYLSDGRMDMSVYGNYCSDTMLDGRYHRDRFLLLSAHYDRSENNYGRIANLCTPARFDRVVVSDKVLESRFDFDGPIPLYSMRYNFLYSNGIKAMKSALDYYGISWDYQVLGLDDLPL